MILRKNWTLGFLGFLGIIGLVGLVHGDWFAFFFWFVPDKKVEMKDRIIK
jgi:hypothetical protein